MNKKGRMAAELSHYIQPKGDAASTLPHRRDRGGSGGRMGNIGWIFAGNSTYALAQWILLSTFARLGTPAMVGRYALALAISAPVYLLCNLSLRTVQVTAGALYGTSRDFLRLRVITATTAFAITILFAFCFDLQTAAVIILTSFAKALDSLADIVFGVLQQLGQLQYNGVSLVINGILTAAVGVFMMALTHAQIWAIAGSVISSAVASVAYPALVLKRLADHEHRSILFPSATGAIPDQRNLWRLALVALPVGLASGLVAFTTNIPQYVLSASHGQESLGIFAALSYVVLLAGLVFGAVAQAELHAFAKLAISSDPGALRRRVTRVALISVMFGLLITAVCTIEAEPILRAVYGDVYAANSRVFSIVSLSMVFIALAYILDAAISAQQRYVNQLVTALVVFTIAAPLSLVAIPRMGLSGAAWVVVVSFAARAAVKAVAFLWYGPQHHETLLGPKGGGR